MTDGQAEKRPITGSGRAVRRAQGQQATVNGAGIALIGGVVNVRVREVVPRLRVAQCQKSFRVPYCVYVDFPCDAVERRRSRAEKLEDAVEAIVGVEPGDAVAERVE